MMHDSKSGITPWSTKGRAHGLYAMCLPWVMTVMSFSLVSFRIWEAMGSPEAPAPMMTTRSRPSDSLTTPNLWWYRSWGLKPYRSRAPQSLPSLNSLTKFSKDLSHVRSTSSGNRQPGSCRILQW